MNNTDFAGFARSERGVSTMTLWDYQSAVNAYINPTVIEERRMNVAQMDVFSRLMMDRIIFLGVAIDDDVANIITAQLLFLESLDPSADISLYINSPGGKVSSGLAIYDTMQLVKPAVSTICTGMAASMGSVLLCAKEIEKTRNELISIIANHSGTPFEKVFADADRDYWMSAEEAKAYGVVDGILMSKSI